MSKIAIEKTRLIIIMLLALAFVYFALILPYYAWPYTVDDAFITLRYAKHLNQYGNLLWNPGEALVEGFSNFLYVLIGAVFIHFHLQAMLLLKALSLSALFISLIAVYAIARLWLSRTYSLLAPLLLLMHPGEIIWAVSGLETAFFQALITTSCYLLIKGFDENQARPVSYALSGLLIAIASLTRPEGPMLFLCFLMLLWLLAYTQKTKKWLAYCLGFTSLYLPYFLWHYFYFGRLFANTIYCKALNAPAAPFELDISYLSIVIPLLLFGLFNIKRFFERRHLFLLLPSCAYLIALTNADWIVGFLDRHFLLAYALLTPFIVLGLVRFVSELKLFKQPKHIELAVILFTLLSGYLFASYQYTPYHYDYLAQSGKEGNELRIEVANWLNQHVATNKSISVGDCGVIPFYFNGRVIDTYCLNNLAMTTKPINFSYSRFNNYLMTTIKPDYIILLALVTRQKAFYPPSDLMLLSDARFLRQYKKIKHFRMGKPSQPGYFYDVYQKRRQST